MSGTSLQLLEGEVAERSLEAQAVDAFGAVVAEQFRLDSAIRGWGKKVGALYKADSATLKPSQVAELRAVADELERIAERLEGIAPRVKGAQVCNGKER